MPSKNVILILRIGAFAVLFGRAWQHLIWDAPYRSLFWDEAWMKPIVESVFGVTWDTYATSLDVNRRIQTLIKIIGGLYALGALVCVLPKMWILRLRPLLIFCSLSLIFLAFLYSKERGYQIAMFIEYAAQFMIPLFLAYAVSPHAKESKLLLWLKVAIVGTFVGHGLYALGFGYPVPGTFIDMTILVLGVTQATAVRLIFFMGIIDMLLVLFLFVPRLNLLACGYAAFWGLATALARPFAYFDTNLFFTSAKQWLPEFIMRVPHAAVPLAALFILLGKIYSQRDTNSRSLQ